jgi:hypothetical protein
MFNRNAHCFDALALNKNLTGLKDLSRIDFKQPRRMQHDGRARRLLGGGRCCIQGRKGENEKCGKQTPTKVWHG